MLLLLFFIADCFRCASVARFTEFPCVDTHTHTHKLNEKKWNSWILRHDFQIDLRLKHSKPLVVAAVAGLLQIKLECLGCSDQKNNKHLCEFIQVRLYYWVCVRIHTLRSEMKNTKKFILFLWKWHTHTHTLPGWSVNQSILLCLSRVVPILYVCVRVIRYFFFCSFYSLLYSSIQSPNAIWDLF